VSNPPKKPQGKSDNIYDDKSDMKKSVRKEYKSRRKKEKEVLDYLVNEHEDNIDEFYDNFEKW